MHTIRFLLPGLALFSISCTTAAIKLMPTAMDSGVTPWTGQGILLSYEIPERDCELTLRNLADNTEYVLPLQKGAHSLLVSAPKGGYKGELLTCPGYRKWELQRFLRQEVELVPGKINFVGHVQLDLDEAGKDLSVLFGDRKRDTDGFTKALKSLPGGWKKFVVSASTTKPLRESMASTGPGEWDERLRIRVKRYVPQEAAGAAQESLEPLQKALSACDQEEQTRYSLRIGRILYVATYQTGRLSGIERKVNDHAFSDELDRCFDDAFQKFTFQGPEKIEVTIEL